MPSCSPHPVPRSARPGVILTAVVAIVAALALVAGGPARVEAADGAQFAGTCDRTYVNEQVDSEQWAITWEIYGDATGNVFPLDGSPPSFIECRLVDETDEDEVFDCYGASPCAEPPCGGSGWTLIADDVAIPLSFFLPPGVDPKDPLASCEVAP